MKGSTSSNLKPPNKQQGFSLQQLSKWHQHLDNQRLKTIHDQEDIKKQKKIAKQSSLQVKNSIQQIEDQAKEISRQLQQQKTKNDHLTILVKKAQAQIYAQKLQKYEDVINNKQTDEFEQQKKILKEKQKTLQKIFDKLNASDFQISKKIDLIRSLKKQRGIHSNLLDKLEREYFDVEFYYKQLLIERTLREKNLQKLTNQFTRIYNKSHANNFKIDAEGYQQKTTLFQSQISKTQKSDSKVPKINFSPQKTINNIEAVKTKKDYNQSKRNADEIHKITFKKKVNHILNDFECKNYQQFVQKNILQIDEKKQDILSLADKTFEDICSLKNQIKSLQSQLQRKKNGNLKKKSKDIKSLPNTLSKIDQETQKQKTQIQKFKNQFFTALKSLLNKENNEEMSESDSQVIKRIQQKQKNLQNFTQNTETLKQMMTFLNDNYLDSKRCQQLPIKSGYNKELTLKFHHNQEAKGRNLSTNKQDGRMKKYETQAMDNECLNQIFEKYQNESQKSGNKTQKVDTVTLLTEKEFYLESKRVISQANKKKSQFAPESSSTKK